MSLDKPISPLQTNHSQVIRVRSDGSDSETIYQQNYWISHVPVNPRDADTILFCHEGGWNIVEQRMWTVHARTGKLINIRVEEKPEISVDHEYWTENGAAVGYHGSYKGRQWVGRVNKDGTNMRDWTLPRARRLQGRQQVDRVLFQPALLAQRVPHRDAGGPGQGVSVPSLE